MTRTTTTTTKSSTVVPPPSPPPRASPVRGEWHGTSVVAIVAGGEFVNLVGRYVPRVFVVPPPRPRRGRDVGVPLLPVLRVDVDDQDDRSSAVVPLDRLAPLEHPVSSFSSFRRQQRATTSTTTPRRGGRVVAAAVVVVVAAAERGGGAMPPSSRSPTSRRRRRRRRRRSVDEDEEDEDHRCRRRRRQREGDGPRHCIVILLRARRRTGGGVVAFGCDGEGGSTLRLEISRVNRGNDVFVVSLLSPPPLGGLLLSLSTNIKTI